MDPVFSSNQSQKVYNSWSSQMPDYKRHCLKIIKKHEEEILNLNQEWKLKVTIFREMDREWNQIQTSKDKLNFNIGRLGLTNNYCLRCKARSINMASIDHDVEKYEMLQVIWEELSHLNHRFLEHSGEKITFRMFFENKKVICGLDLTSQVQKAKRDSYLALEEGYQVLPSVIQDIVKEYFFNRATVGLCIDRQVRIFPDSLQDTVFSVMACVTSKPFGLILTHRLEFELKRTDFLKNPHAVSSADREIIYQCAKDAIIVHRSDVPFELHLNDTINKFLEKDNGVFLRNGEIVYKNKLTQKSYNLLKKLLEHLPENEICDSLFDTLLMSSDFMKDDSLLVRQFFKEVMLPKGIFSSWGFIVKLIEAHHPSVDDILLYAQKLNREDILLRVLNYGICARNPQNLNISLIEKACHFGAKITQCNIKEIHENINLHLSYKPKQDREFLRHTINETLISLQKYQDQNAKIHQEEITSQQTNRKTIDFTDAFEASTEEKEKEEDILEQCFMANNIRECLDLLSAGMTPSIPFLLKVITAGNVGILKKCVEMHVVFDDVCKEKALSIGNPQITKLILEAEDEFGTEDVEEKESKMTVEEGAEDGWGDFEEDYS